MDNIAYCGLDCHECKKWFGEVREHIVRLNSKLKERNFTGIAKAIPFMNAKYKGYLKMAKFFTGEECPGCRQGGGNPFCSIRKCSKNKAIESCAECDSLYCKKFKGLLKIHNDGKIQRKIREIQQ